MRKIISIILSTVIIVMSLFSTTAFAQGQTRYDKWIENNNVNEIEANIYTDDGYESTKTHVYIKGNKVSVSSVLPVFENEYEINIIYDGKNICMVFADLPFFHFKLEELDISVSDLRDELSSYREATFIESYEVTERGTAYYVEEYSTTYDFEDYYENGIVKFYFIGDDLIKYECIYTDEYGNEKYTCVEHISFEVDDSVFEIPWYSIDLFPLFELLLNLYNSMLAF